MFSSVKRAFSTIFFWLLGAAFIVFGVYMFMDYSGLTISNPKEAPGVVVNVYESTLKSDNPLQSDVHSRYPTIQFKNESGQTVEYFETWASQDDDSYFFKGQKLTVIYNSENPEEARVKVDISLWGQHLILIGLGLIILCVPWFNKVANS